MPFALTARISFNCIMENNNKQLRDFVASTIESKNLSGVEDDVKDQLINELTVRLEDQINRALINSLDEKQFEEFEKLVQSNDIEQIKTYFENKPNINVQEIVTRVMTSFRASYLKS